MKTSIRRRVREAGRDRAREEARRIVDGPESGPFPIGFDFARYASKWTLGPYRDEWFAGFDDEVETIRLRVEFLPPTTYRSLRRIADELRRIGA